MFREPNEGILGLYPVAHLLVSPKISNKMSARNLTFSLFSEYKKVVNKNNFLPILKPNVGFGLSPLLIFRTGKD